MRIACPSRIGNQRNCIRLLDGTARRAIGDIGARELERPPAIIAAAGVERRGMVRESEQMSPQELIEAGSRGIELSLGLFEPALRSQHIGQAPIDLWIAARKRWQEKRLRVAGSLLARVNLRQVHTRLYIARQVTNCTLIPERGKIRVR